MVVRGRHLLLRFLNLFTQLGDHLFQDDGLTLLNLIQAIGLGLRFRVGEADLFASLDVIGYLRCFHSVTSVWSCVCFHLSFLCVLLLPSTVLIVSDFLVGVNYFFKLNPLAVD